MKLARIILFCATVLMAAACGSKGDTPASAPGADTAAVSSEPPPKVAADTTTLPVVADGPVDIKYPDGHSRIKGNMRNSKRHGMWTSYFPDGRPQSFSGYVDGELHGTTVVYHANGTTHYTGDYRKGKQVGAWRFFDEKGTLVRTVTYDSTGTVINDRK